MGTGPDKATQEQILQFMTTEHFTLQTAKSATVAEANGRWCCSRLPRARSRMRRYFIHSANDGVEGALHNMGILPSSSEWQHFVTNAGTVAVINSVLAGVRGERGGAPPLPVE